MLRFCAFAVRAISRHFCFVKRTDRGTVVTTSLLYFTPCPHATRRNYILWYCPENNTELKRPDCYLPRCYRWSRIVEHKASWAVLDLGIAIDGHRKM
jgi:hypothetical protein